MNYQELNEEVMQTIDEALDTTIDKVCDKYPNQTIAIELFMCLQQFAIGVAQFADIDEETFISAVRRYYRIAEGQDPDSTVNVVNPSRDLN